MRRKPRCCATKWRQTDCAMNQTSRQRTCATPCGRRGGLLDAISTAALQHGHERAYLQQALWTLFSRTAIHSLDYDLRALPPACSGCFALDMDLAATATAMQLLGVRPCEATTDVVRQVQLPLESGGFGVRPLAELCDAAGLGYAARALPIAAHILSEVAHLLPHGTPT